MLEKLKNIEVVNSKINFREPVLASGAELKNTFCLAKQKRLYVSNDNGNLEYLDNLIKFESKIGSLLRSRAIKPKIVAYDLHPEYISTKFASDFAEKNKIDKTIAVQHHHAHIVSCMLDNDLQTKVIGVGFDGTGFGTDGNIWGGEFLIADYNNFKRSAHLKYIPMPGAKLAILEPWRMSVSWLHTIFKDKVLKLNIDFIKRLDKARFKVIKQMIDKNINSPLTSSMGRFFDAASSLILGRHKVEYEAQAAVELEEMAFSAMDKPFRSYGFSVENEDSCLIIDPAKVFLQIVRDLQRKISKEEIAYKFHCTVSKMIKDVCLILRGKTRLNKVVLSGGVFQNRIVSELSFDILQKEKFKVFSHKTIPINDAGISIGQAIVANARFSKKR